MNYKCTYSDTATYIGNGQYQNPVTGETTTGAEYALRYNCASQGGGCTSEVFSGDYFNDVDPGTEYLEEVTINVQDPKSYQRALNKIMADIESRGWHQRMVAEAQGSGGGDGGLGNWLSGFDIAAGAYSEYGHNHTTYSTTKGIEKNIYKANGQIRSARAAGFARASNLVRGVAVVGSIVSTTYSGYQVYDQIQTGGLQNVNGWDATDTGVGLLGLGATGAVYFGLISNPVGWAIGAGVLIYSGSRLAYDLYNKP